jgi:hypothetical protein
MESLERKLKIIPFSQLTTSLGISEEHYNEYGKGKKT